MNERSRRRLAAVGGRLALLLLSTLIGLGLAEALCRQFVTVGSFRWVGEREGSWNEPDEELDYRLKAGWRGWVEAPEYRHRVEINSRNFRGPEPGDEKAVWMLGDSFVFGIGCEIEDSLPGQLEKLLAQSGGKMKGPVWDLGVPSWSGPQYSRELERRLAEARPAAVVVVFFLGERISGANDLIGALDFHPGKKAEVSAIAGPNEPRRKSETFKKWLARNSALYNAMISRFGPGLRGLLRRHQELAPQDQEKIEKGWARLGEDLRRFAALAQKEKIQLLVVAMPEMGDLAKGDSKIGARFTELARQAGLPALDLSPLLAKEPLGEISYPRDGHLKSAGNRLAAVAIAKALAEFDEKPAER